MTDIEALVNYLSARAQQDAEYIQRRAAELKAAGAQVFTADEPEPEFGSGTVVAVNYGDYRNQEIWVASSANIGNWYPLGGEFGRPKVAVDPRDALQKLMDPAPFRPGPGEVPLHPTWSDIVARGPVVLLVPTQRDAYQAGWADGRRRLLEQIEKLHDNEDTAREVKGTGI